MRNLLFSRSYYGLLNSVFLGPLCTMTDWVDETTVVDIVYLYFRKAFDTATHQIVTEKLVKHGLEELKNGQTDIVNPW